MLTLGGLDAKDFAFETLQFDSNLIFENTSVVHWVYYAVHENHSEQVFE